MADNVISTYSNSSSGVLEMSDTIFEDVEGVIQNIAPHDTPFMAAIGKAKATNTLHEWLEDSLKQPTGSNAAVEGADATATDREAPERLSNYTQIFEDTFKVSGTLDATNTIGRKEQSKYELGKSMKYLATEQEHAFINNASAGAGGSGSGRTAKGLSGWVSTNDDYYESYAASNDFSESDLMKMAEDCYSAGGDPSMLLIPPRQARVIADWDQNSRVTVNTNASEKTLVMAVMVLETPYGKMKVVIDRWIKPTAVSSGVTSDTAYLIDPTRFKVAYLRPMKTSELAKTGDARKYQSVVESTLVCHNEEAAAKAANLASPDAT